MNPPLLLTTSASSDYALLDSGEGEKLERFGGYTLSRPDPQALWKKNLDAQQWKKADATFSRGEKQGDWSLKPTLPMKWDISFGGLKFSIKPTAFKHVGLFPEQAANWEWMRNAIEARRKKLVDRKDSPSSELPAPNFDIEVLNLFGYTGGATLACAQAGAKVVHIDGSKVAIGWARENAELSGLADKPIRWILDDARAFVKREIKRGRKYHGIIMDPPSFGHGPENELWKIEEHFLALLDDCRAILADDPIFFLINGYAAGYSSIAYGNNLLPLKEKFGGEIETGELVIKEEARNGEGEAGKKEAARLLPCGIFARWSK